MKHPRLPATLALALVLAGSALTALPRTALANSYPGYVHSHYVTSTSTTAIHTAGFNLGQAVLNGNAPTDALVILAFGYPYKKASTNTWGVLFNTSSFPFVSNATITALAESFAGGYWAGSPSTSHLTLVVGLNSAQTSDGNFFTTTQAGHWADLVDSVNAWLVSSGYSSQVTAVGGADMENAARWQTADKDRDWVDAYGAASPSLTYNFGDAAGCPYTTYSGSACSAGFDQSDFWYISWGSSAAVPAPEIYNTTYVYNGSYRTDHNAQQWEMIKRYGIHHQSSTMTIQSSATQRTACNQVGCSSGTDNTPATGWGDLYNALNHDQAPSETAQDLKWETDFEWGYSPCSTDPSNPGTAPC
jgi:hypothetical protein